MKLKSTLVTLSKSDSYERFNTAIKKLSHQECIARLRFIQRKIKQYHLNCDIYSVVNEAYLRGIKTLAKGEDIKEPLPWISQTAHNIIREWSRQQTKLISDSLFLENHIDPTSIEAETSTAIDPEVKQLLNKALATLNPNDQTVLKLRWVDGLSWKEVANTLSHEEDKEIKADTARKRGGRALDKLRKTYQAMAKK